MKRFLLCGLFACVCVTVCHAQTITVKCYPDSVIKDVSNHPIGINLDFFMDGGRFPDAKHSVQEDMGKMGIKYLRYPGGEKSDLYLFSVPPYEKSSPHLARTAGLGDYPGVITPDKKGFTYDPLDFDEFMTICKTNHAEPVIVVAADCYLLNTKPGERLSTKEELIKNAVEWVRYANIKKKYGVKYWMIGNESWNSNNENSNVNIYAQDVIDFSKAMKAVDPSILTIANGASDDFFRTVIQKAGNYFDRLCVSNYGVNNFFKGYNTYKDTTQDLIEPAETALNAMNKYATPDQKKKFKMIVAEFGSIDWANHWKGTNDMGHAIVVFDMAGQLIAQPQIEYSCFWTTRWIENESHPGADHDALDKDGNINPTGVALQIWGKFMGNKMVKVESAAPIVSYACTDGDKLYLYLINKSETKQRIGLNLGGYQISNIAQSWEYFGKDADDIKPKWHARNDKSINSYLLKPFSINVIELKINRNKK